MEKDTDYEYAMKQISYILARIELIEKQLQILELNYKLMDSKK